MMKLNDAKLLKLFDELEDNDDSVCDDYGLWEALTANVLSPAGIRCVAEHLIVCSQCRKACADAYKMEEGEETPLYARIRRYKENPDSETDKYFEIIAKTYLGTIEIDVEGTIKTGANQPPQVAGNEVKLGAVGDYLIGIVSCCYKRNEERYSAWGRFFQNKRASLGVACSFAAALAVVAGVTLRPNKPDAPGIDDTRQLDPELDGLRDFLSQLDATQHNLSRDWNVGDSKSATLGGSKALRAPILGLRGLNIITPQYNDAIDSFNDGDYRTAAKNFGKLVKKLEKNKSVDAETIDDAYWNWGVATLNSGEKKKAAKIFRELKKRDINVEMRIMTESALEKCQN